MKTIRLISWNVNGIRAVHRKNALDWFFKNRPDIFCIQETKAHPEQLDEILLNVEGYHTYFSSAERKGYSGVGLYSNIKPKSVENDLGERKFDTEGRTLVADYDKFLLLNIYFPNGKASMERLKYKMDFYDAFLKKVSGLLKRGRKIVICGDVNTAHREIDLAHPKENEKVSGFLPAERAWIDALLKAGFIDTFRMFSDKPEQYTWWDMKSRARERNIGWRIDYFYVSDNLKKNVADAGIMADIEGSDHCPISLDLSI